jgi:hypothetical protein
MGIGCLNVCSRSYSTCTWRELSCSAVTYYNVSPTLPLCTRAGVACISPRESLLDEGDPNSTNHAEIFQLTVRAGGFRFAANRGIQCDLFDRVSSLPPCSYVLHLQAWPSSLDKSC